MDQKDNKNHKKLSTQRKNSPKNTVELRVVLDTNIIVGGVFPAKSNPRRIVEALLDRRFNIILSDGTYGEITRVLGKIGGSRPARLPKDFIENLDRFLRDNAVWVPDRKLDSPVCGDPSDDKFFAAAHEGRARYLVSNDKLVLEVGIFEGVEIISASAFVDILSRET